jgi:endopeptidase La
MSDSPEQIRQKTIEYRLLNDIENIYYDLIDEKNKINKEKQIYMEKVDKILDNAVYGHSESKREIKRLVAQWMSGKMEGSILGFHGPPGVGKTCFAKKGISKCLFDSEGNNRPFCIFQLGGATDGSVLEGHSYTYVGAKPGRLIEFLQETKCMNPIIYFDELDKVSETEKGKEIIDILIHLTDRSQNKELFDKYFSGIELDFSKCIIIFSYNDASKVNRILRDRITEIKINPLKKNEKIYITKNYTFKEIEDELNFNCVMSDELIEYIIDTYTFEAGVRKLNEKFYQIFREINLRILENPFLNLEINEELVDEILTRHFKMKHYQIHSKPKVGLINGLYASTIGIGGITLIQIIKILTTSSNIPLELTGQQGNVMKESMSCAKTLALNLLSNIEKETTMEELKLHPFGLHIHCPDGATPKDGPSAGITITTGIYSVLTGKKIRNDIAMTGEVDLLGNVKAIGGLDAKINGAIKAGVKLVIFPKENEQDWDKIVKNKSLDGEIEIYMVETIEQVIDKAICFE